MIKDLNNIYDPEGKEDPGPGPKPPTKAPAPGPGPVRGNQGYARLSPTNVGAYENYMPDGVYDERGDREGGLDTIRGLNQSFGEKLGRKAGNLIPNIAANLVDMVGNVGSLFAEWGDDRNYSNAFNDIAASMKDPFGQAYQHDNSTWAIGDSAWWLNNIFSTAEYAGAFALGGAGAGKVLGGLGELLGGGKLVTGAAQLGTSALVSYAEAAQGGMQVYNEVYNTQLRKHLAAGLGPDEAKQKAGHIASQSAATAAQLGTLLTMGINVGAYTPLFRSEKNVALDIISKRMAAAETTSMGELGRVIRGTNAADYMDKLLHHSSIRDKLSEMVKEGGEEVLQQFAQVTGSEIGNKGKIEGFGEQFGELSHVIDRTADAQGALSFALGAAFGGIQNVLLHNMIPSSRVDKVGADGNLVQKVDSKGNVMVGKDGIPKTVKQWVTPRTAEHDFVTRKFEDLKDAVATDFERFDELHDNILNGIKNKKPLEVDEAKDELFNTSKLHAIKSGLVEPWIKTFQGIGNMYQEDAIAAGYAEDENDISYKEKAQEAVADIGELQSMYGKLTKAYGDGETVKPLIDMVFGRQADLYSTKKRIDKFRKALELSEQDEKAVAKITNPARFSELVDKYERQRTSFNEVNHQLVEDHGKLMSKDKKAVDRLLRKYRAIGFGEGSVKEVISDLSAKLVNKQAEVLAKVKEAEEALYASPDYTSWLDKNPGKTFDAFLESAKRGTYLAAKNRYNRMALDEHEVQYQIAQENLSDMTSSKNVTRFSNKVKAWQDQMIADYERIQENNRIKLAALAKDKTTANRLQKIELHKIAEAHKNDRDNAYRAIAENNAKLQKLKAELDNKSVLRDPLRVLSLRSQIKALEKDNRIQELQALRADSLYQEYDVSIEPETEEMEAEELTGEEDGDTATDVAADDPTTNTEGSEPSEEDIFNDIIGSSPEVEAEEIPGTIKDELEALLAGESIAPEADTEVIEDYDKQLKKLPPAIRSIVSSVIDNLINGGEFSLDALNGYIGKLLSLKQAHNILLAAKNYAEEIIKLKVAPTEVASSSNEKEEEIRKLQEIRDTNIANIQNPLNDWNGLSLKAGEVANEDNKIKAIETENSAYEYGLKRIEDKYNQESEPILTSPVIQTSGVGQPNTPIIDNADEALAVTPESPGYHAGYKIIEGATMGATSTIGYTEGKRLGKKGETIFFKVTLPDKLNENLNEDVLKPTKLKVHHKLKYVVDTEYDGPANITDNLSWDTNQEVVQGSERAIDYMEGGKVRRSPDSIGEIPIKVLDAVTGEYLFHIHKLSWIRASFPNTKDYRNVVEKVWDGQKWIDNIALQTQTLMDLRTRIVEKFNNDGSAADGKIAKSGKGTGRLILNHVISGKSSTMDIKSSVVNEFAWNRSEPDKSMLPDKKLTLVIADQDQVLLAGHQFKFKGKIGFADKVPKGAVGAMVPAANGEFMYAPLIGMKLVESGKPSVAMNTVARAIELYLLNDGSKAEIGKEIKELEKETGFNVGTSKGLRSFVSQYFTYLQSFKESDLSPNIKTDDKSERFVFDIDDKADGLLDKTKQIKIGFTMRGKSIQYANLVKGTLSPAFLNMMQEGFETRSRAVNFTRADLNLKGINSSGKFKDAIYVPGKGWSHNEYENYNQYVKSFSKTPVYGRNQLKDGTYVYTANPHLPMDFSALKQETALTVKPNASPTESVLPAQPDIDLKALSDFDDMTSFSLKPKPAAVQAIGTGPDGSKSLSVETLTEIYNFTPEGQRNGKTVQEILDELSFRGHTFIPEGFNPFSRCL